MHDGPPIRNWALSQEDKDTNETYYLSLLCGLDECGDWMYEWVDDLDAALLLEWPQMVSLACSLKTGPDCEVVPVQDEPDDD